MTKPATTIEVEAAQHDSFCCTTTIAALLFLAAKFPHHQFNSAALASCPPCEAVFEKTVPL